MDADIVITPDDLIFADGEGRKWSLKIKIAAADRMRDAGIDPRYIFDREKKLFSKLLSDYRELSNAVWLIIQPAAEKLSVAREAFIESIDGQVIEDMGEAFIRAIADFSPAAMRKSIIAGLKKGDEVETAKRSGLQKSLAKVDPATIEQDTMQEMDQQIAILLNKSTATVGPNSNSNAQASSGSIQPPSLLES